MGNWCNVQCQSEINLYEKILHGDLSISEFPNPLSIKLKGHGQIFHQSAYDCWKRKRGRLIEVESLVQFRFDDVHWKMTQNHIFLIFDKWGHQHQIIFFILWTKWFAIEEYLIIKEGQTQHKCKEKEKWCPWFWGKKGENFFIFIKIHITFREKLKASWNSW